MKNKNEKARFTFSDIFAGIGGFRIGLEKVRGKCVYSSEWDRFAEKTYKAWFNETPAGDIKDVKPTEIPYHDILAAGFPCQPFSLAGVTKKKSLGHPHGFKDVTQGTLFFNLATIIEVKRPSVIFLENVKNLLSHDKGRTWEIIKNTLRELEYVFFDKIIDAKHYVPQKRERIFLVGFDEKEYGTGVEFEFPNYKNEAPSKIKDILENDPDIKYTLSDHLWEYLQAYKKKHKELGHGFGFGLAPLEGKSRTLSARYYKDGSEILIPQGDGKNPRRLTPRECARLMGFDDKFKIVVSDTQAYRQFGNAVVPGIIEDIGKKIVETMDKHFADKIRKIKEEATILGA